MSEDAMHAEPTDTVPAPPEGPSPVDAPATPTAPTADTTADTTPGPDADDTTTAVPDLDAMAADLDGVDAALARLADGTYWTDEITGEPIPDDVLVADPMARRA